jgi:two-component system response regulator ChvI
LEHHRHSADDNDWIEAGPLRLDLKRYQLSFRGDAVPLTVTEFMILHALVKRPGHVKTRAQLMEESYPNDAYVSERTIDSHIKRLRAKLTDFDSDFDAIETVYGLGYRFRENT